MVSDIVGHFNGLRYRSVQLCTEFGICFSNVQVTRRDSALLKGKQRTNILVAKATINPLQQLNGQLKCMPSSLTHILSIGLTCMHFDDTYMHVYLVRSN